MTELRFRVSPELPAVQRRGILEHGAVISATGRLTEQGLETLVRTAPNVSDRLPYMRLTAPEPALRAGPARSGDADPGVCLDHPSCLTMDQALVAVLAEPEARDEERALLLRVQAGDAAAFDVLVRRHLPRARLIARRLMRNPDDADDLVQDAFLRAFERIGTFDASRAFEPWFTRLLVNRGRDLHRKQNIRRTESHEPETVPGGTRPDREAENSELGKSLNQALDALPERQRLIVSLFEIDGHSTEEIAGMLKVSQVTVRWHLHQARRTLREALKEWVE